MNFKSSLLLLLSLFIIYYCIDHVQCLQTSNFHSPHSRWIRGKRADPNQSIVITLAIKHRDVSKMLNTFKEVSNPKHEKYGQYLSLQHLAQQFGAQQHQLDKILNWLKTQSCGNNAHVLSSRDWIKVECKISEIESLMSTQMYSFYHSFHKTLSAIRAYPTIDVPQDIAELIDFIDGVNTPIHDHRQTHIVAHGSAFDQLQYQHQDLVSISSDITPSINRVDGGNGMSSLSLQIRCVNGQLNTDSGSTPCASNPPAVTNVYVQLQVMTPGYPANSIFNVPNSAINCVQTSYFNRITNSSVITYPCHVTVGNGQLINYLPLTATTKVEFSSGVSTNWSASSSLFVCKEWVTPSWLRDLYHIDPNIVVRSPENTVAVAEFLEQYYSPDDLVRFMKNMGLPTRAAKNVQLVGPNNATEGSISGGEAQLDIQYLMGVAVNATTWFFSTAGRNEYNNEEPFLQWLTTISDMNAAPLVHSISYGDMEDSLPKSYTDRINLEFVKMGSRGLTVLFSSGDDGAASYYARQNLSYCNQAHPEFPASSPYITSVGATQLSRVSTSVCSLIGANGLPLSCSSAQEVVCTSAFDGVITSGGGFSNYYEPSEDQASYIKSYLQNTDIILPPASFFNASGRGIPDIAAYGNNYLVLMGQQYQVYSGTSASTPVIAAMVSLWNDIRLLQNQPSLGFLNPFLYSLAREHPEAFFDVITGDNKCLVRGYPCCTQGFAASEGWDPVTGLGTPRWDVIANIIMNPDNMFPYLSGSSSTNNNNNNNNDNQHKSAFALSIAAIVVAGVAIFITTLLFWRSRGTGGRVALIDE